MNRMSFESGGRSSGQEKYPPGTILNESGKPYREEDIFAQKPREDVEEAESLIDDSVTTEESGGNFEGSVDEYRELLDLLNKARQGSVEHEDVYWHVFGKGATGESTYPDSIIGRPDLIEKFSVGKDKPYNSTATASHDLIEYLSREAEEGLRHSEALERINKEKEILKPYRDALDLLNKARQGSVEHEDVYWHVFGRGSTSELPYLKEWVNRPDLIEKFSVGKDKPYNSTATASHDLIEYLSYELEDKLRGTSPEPLPSEDSEKEVVDQVPEVINPTPEPDEPESEPLGPEPVTPDPELVPNPPNPEPEPVIPNPEPIPTPPSPEPIPTPPNPEPIPTPPNPEPPPLPPENVDNRSLEDLRDDYLKAKRLRGNVFRGKFGRFFNRTLGFGEEDMDFGGRHGALELETVRNVYQERLSQYRSTELTQLNTHLEERIIRGEITEAERDSLIASRICELLNEEQNRIDARASEGIERNLLEKMKTKWRQYNKTRLGVGILLTGVAFTPIGASAALVGARAAYGGVGTYMGVEAGLERYSKLVGHKGLVRNISKEGPFITEDALYRHISSLPLEDVRKEAARLRMLQVEKGVAIGNLNTLGDNGRIAELIIRRDNQITVEETLTGAHAGDPTRAFAERLSERLSRETNARNEAVESEVDRERIKKMVRKTTAVLAGGATGWLIGGKLLSQDATTGQGEVVTSEPPPSQPEAVIDPGTLESSYSHTVSSGDNTWKIIESQLDSQSLLNGLSEGQRTHTIDALKDVFERMNPSELKGIGFSSGDIDLLKVGDALNLSGVLDNPEIVSKALLNAKNLSPEDIAEIVKNNAKIAEWLSTHKSELKQIFDGEMVDKVLKGLV